MDAKHELRVATARDYSLNMYVGYRQTVTDDFVEKNGLKYLKLIKKLPPVLENVFGSFATKIAKECEESNNMYEAAWIIQLIPI